MLALVAVGGVLVFRARQRKEGKRKFTLWAVAWIVVSVVPCVAGGVALGVNAQANYSKRVEAVASQQHITLVNGSYSVYDGLVRVATPFGCYISAYFKNVDDVDVILVSVPHQPSSVVLNYENAAQFCEPTTA